MPQRKKPYTRVVIRPGYNLSVQQFYRVEPDEKVIDQELAEVIYTDEKWRTEESERLHRLYHLIIGDEKLLNEVLLYTVIREHDLRTGEYGYFKEYYKSDIELPDILWMYKSLLHPADLAWLKDLRARVEKNEENEDPLLEIEPLVNAFRDGIKPTGFTVGQETEGK